MSARPISIPLTVIIALFSVLGGILADRVYIASVLSEISTTLKANQATVARLDNQDHDIGQLVTMMRNHQIRNEGLIDLHTQEIGALRLRMGLPALVLPQALTSTDK